LDEKAVLVEPGDKIGIGYVELVFTKPGRYIIKASINGPNLTSNEAAMEIIVKPKPIKVNYENETSVYNWTLSIRIEPEHPTIHDNLTLEVSLKYTGNNTFKVEGALPLIKSVKLTHANGTDYWSIATPQHISIISIKPGYNQTLRFTLGEEPQFPHRFTPGIYKLEANATIYTPKGQPIDTSVALFIEIEG
jgi:hypothetical protein